MDLEAFATAFSALHETPDSAIYLACCEGPASSGASLPPIKLVYPRFREDSPDIDALVEHLWYQAINYVIPLRKRIKAKNTASTSATGGDLSSVSRLLKETKRAFIEYRTKYPYRASEVGELLAYLLALGYLDAAQIASKMALKTNGNMPLHGLDGVHAHFKNGVMTLYFLESKLSATANDGVKEYAESTAGFGSNRKQYLLEYEILSELGNLDALDAENREIALEYLDVYGPKKSCRIERSVGVICYSEHKHFASKLSKSKTISPDDHEKKFATLYAGEYEHHRKAAEKHLTNNGVDPAECEVFFLAVPDVDTLRDLFYENLTNG